MSDREYTPEDNQRDRTKIVRKVIDGRLHIDGVPVYHWQLTPDELKEYFPDRYIEKFGHGPMPCPIDNCNVPIQTNDIRSFRMHCYHRHEARYQEIRDQVDKVEDIAELFKQLKEGSI